MDLQAQLSQIHPQLVAGGDFEIEQRIEACFHQPSWCVNRKHKEVSSAQGQRPAHRQRAHRSLQPQHAVGDPVDVGRVLQARTDRLHGQSHPIGPEALQPQKT